jgi:hypothetical protein
MGDGGKGSAPRPFSVDQTTFGNNFDRIFDKNKVAVFECYCYNCNKGNMSQMFLCPVCGNKRCPHATNHTLACTNSNEPGQPGSRYS